MSSEQDSGDDIPIVLGESFFRENHLDSHYYALRYTTFPDYVDTETPAKLQYDFRGKNLSAIFGNSDDETSAVLFKGLFRETSDDLECALLYDAENNQYVLERLAGFSTSMSKSKPVKRSLLDGGTESADSDYQNKGGVKAAKVKKQEESIKKQKPAKSNTEQENQKSNKKQPQKVDDSEDVDLSDLGLSDAEDEMMEEAGGVEIEDDNTNNHDSEQGGVELQEQDIIIEQKLEQAENGKQQQEEQEEQEEEEEEEDSDDNDDMDLDNLLDQFLDNDQKQTTVVAQNSPEKVDQVNTQELPHHTEAEQVENEEIDTNDKSDSGSDNEDDEDVELDLDEDEEDDEEEEDAQQEMDVEVQTSKKQTSEILESETKQISEQKQQDEQQQSANQVVNNKSPSPMVVERTTSEVSLHTSSKEGSESEKEEEEEEKNGKEKGGGSALEMEFFGGEEEDDDSSGSDSGGDSDGGQDVEDI